MPQLPEQLPEVGDFKELYAWLNKLRAYTASLKPKRTATMDFNHTSAGIHYKPRVSTVNRQQGGQFWL